MRIYRPSGRWHTRTTFVFALSASAVGLGNIWRFAYLLGENGGAPFMVAYLACLFLIAVPVLIAEVVIGNEGRGSPLLAWRWSAHPAILGRLWPLWALLACLTGLLMLGILLVVAGWALAYAFHMQQGTFAAASAFDVAAFYQALLESPRRMLGWQSLFLLMILGILTVGVRRGIGIFVWIAVPAMMALLWLLIDFALQQGNLVATRELLFSAQPLDFTRDSVLLALGHAFYTLSIGAAVGLAYGAYAPDRVPLARSVLAVAIFDAAVAVAIAVAIYPIMLAANIQPAVGPGMLFVSAPYAFGNVPLGDTYGSLFFVLVAVASLGSAVALLEPTVSTVSQHTPLPRPLATLLAGGVVWLLAAALVLSLQPASALHGLFMWLDRFIATMLLPAGALAVCVLVGWRRDEEQLRRQMYREPEGLIRLWLLLLRFVAPLVILVVWFRALTFG